MTDASEYFRMEAVERLGRLRTGLLALERTPADPGLVTDLFREAHSLKGAAGIVGQSEISEVCHGMEDRLSAIRDTGRKVVPPLIDALIEATDAVEALLDSGVEDPERGELVKSAIGRLASLAGSEAASSEEPGAETAGPAEAERTRREGAPTPPRSSGSAAETVRLDRRRLEALADLTGELRVAGDRLHHRTRTIRGLHERVREAAHRHAEDSRLREVLRPIETAARALADDSAGDLGVIEPLIAELHERVLDCQMLPLSTLFDELPRFVRDQSRREGKQVGLRVSGASTRVDRKVLEQLRDPIIHMIRNAISHGIEAPEERERLGKPPQGTVCLTTARRGDRTRIVCEDDGRGIPHQKVLERAISSGDLSKTEAAGLSRGEIERLILRPGLSTAEAVSEISGRGVGMDAVASRIEVLHGTLEIESEPDRFTRFAIEFPASIATVEGLLVEAAGYTTVVPTASVVRTGSVASAELQSAAGRLMAELDGRALPLVMLANLLERPVKAEHRSGKIPVVVVRHRGGEVAVGVERLRGIQTVVIRGLGDHIGSVAGVAGATILGNGRPALVLEPSELVRGCGAVLSAPLASKPEQEAVPDRAPILIVDDSLITRMMEKSILESAGHAVEMAVSAEDALSKVRLTRYGLFVVDVEMPGLDGFELTRRLRQLEPTAETPIVIVSSLATDAHRREGLEAGANDYIVKGEFDQRRLLETVERLLRR